MTILVTLLLMLLLLLLKGFFSGSEIALVSSDKIKLRHQARMGNKGAQAVLKLFQTPDILLGTTLVGTNIATVALTTLGTLLLVDLFGNDADLYALLIYSPLFLIFGEIVPKSVYQQHATLIAPYLIRILALFTKLFFPLIFIFSRIARFIAHLTGSVKADSSLFISREQIRSIVELAEMGSNLDVFDRYRIKRAIRFSDTTVGQVMTPVADMVALDKDSSLENAVRLCKSLSFNDIPIYDGNISNIVGVLSLSPWDIMELDLKNDKLSDIISPALFVTENQYLEELFLLFDKQDCRTAIAVDEFGTCIGMIDKQDLYEEVVGDLEETPEDQSRRRYRKRMMCQKLSEGSMLIDAKVPISEVNEILGTKINGQDYFSLGGLMLAHLHHLPAVGESFEDYGYRFTIDAMSERAIKTVRVDKLS
ncbi:hemolysin family protein [Methylomarinum sp. Ch1-1]|uniref:Hemolysin family protein n=1 Tax=Methylomarinum roseum TaxID=3067653 RepID=A0AAU7NRB9_9GAMM|nr:hemolysin family protein [Methylomarinum sp. Ch1-1]MDP4520540.1 hemolysin family protein [Methylomarinum sp. Ch1-1]